MAEALVIGAVAKLGVSAAGIAIPKLISGAVAAAPIIASAATTALPVIEAISDFTKVCEFVLQAKEMTPKLLEAMYDAFDQIKPPNIQALTREGLLEEYDRNLKVMETLNKESKHLSPEERKKNDETVQKILERTKKIVDQYQKLSTATKPKSKGVSQKEQEVALEDAKVKAAGPKKTGFENYKQPQSQKLSQTSAEQKDQKQTAESKSSEQPKPAESEQDKEKPTRPRKS